MKPECLIYIFDFFLPSGIRREEAEKKSSEQLLERIKYELGYTYPHIRGMLDTFGAEKARIRDRIETRTGYIVDLEIEGRMGVMSAKIICSDDPAKTLREYYEYERMKK